MKRQELGKETTKEILDLNLMNFFFFFNFWLRHVAYRILVSRPGIKPTPPAVEVRSLNHWTSSEVPMNFLLSLF